MPNNEVLFGKYGKPAHEKTVSEARKEMMDEESSLEEFDED